MKTYFSLKGILNPAVNADSQPRTPRDMLLDDIRKTQCALEIAYSGFDNVTDPDLIDCYIYEVNSALKRYRFLLQQAAQMQLYEEYHMDSPEAADRVTAPGDIDHTQNPLAVPYCSRLSLTSVLLYVNPAYTSCAFSISGRD